MACPNGSVPLLLPWTNNSVSAAGAVLSRGISFTVGTPPQPFSLTPSTLSNNLFVNSAVECTAVTNSSCLGQLGGVYDSATSTSFAQVNYAAWAGSRNTVDSALASTYIFLEDSVAFGLKPTANKFSPFPIYTNGSSDSKFTMKRPYRCTVLTVCSQRGCLRRERAGFESNITFGAEFHFPEPPCRLWPSCLQDLWTMGWI